MRKIGSMYQSRRYMSEESGKAFDRKALGVWECFIFVLW